MLQSIRSDGDVGNVLSAPIVLYQIWAFIAPGLYANERRRVLPILVSTVALFLCGGAFAYYIVLPYSLVFLVSAGDGLHVESYISIASYFETFVNVILGVSVAFELPMIVFFLTLLHIATPVFLMRHSRYAVLAIALLAAIVTPSPNAFDMAMFFVPMVLLYYLGVFASYLLVLRRDEHPFPWREAIVWLAAAGAISTGAVFLYRRHLVK